MNNEKAKDFFMKHMSMKGNVTSYNFQNMDELFSMMNEYATLPEGKEVDIEKLETLAKEYATGLMGQDYEKMNHGDQTMFNTIVKTAKHFGHLTNGKEKIDWPEFRIKFLTDNMNHDYSGNPCYSYNKTPHELFEWIQKNLPLSSSLVQGGEKEVEPFIPMPTGFNMIIVEGQHINDGNPILLVSPNDYKNHWKDYKSKSVKHIGNEPQLQK